MLLIAWKIVRAVALIGFAIWVTSQVRKPKGWLGRRAARAMNITHSIMTDWGLQQVTIKNDAAILDVGCGGGRTIQKLAIMAPQGKVMGVDYSTASVAVARETNADEIKTGHVQIQQGSVAALPCPNDTFDLVTAVETHYYWPDLPASVREVLRVLKPGGQFVLIAETYRGGPLKWLYAIAMPLLRAALLSDDEHRNLLAGAGFTDVETRFKKGTNWIVAIGRKPAGRA